jgi:2-polyprenyl-6-methoxyphenol hydroxylase-like FAD-dependent oxidoreductase
MTAQTVLISGAGIAGPTLAFWLRAAGFEPVLIERTPALRTGGYVVDFWGCGYDIAERMCLTDDIHRVGYHARELRIVNRQGARRAGFGTDVFYELTGGRFVTIGRSDLSRLLYDKIKGLTEVIFGNEIVGLHEQADAVQVQFRRAGARRFDLVIGADGLHSNIRSLAFGPQDQFERPLGYIAAAFQIRGYRPRNEEVYVMYGAPGRMVGRFALHDDRTLFLFVFAADADIRTATPDLPAQKKILCDRFGDGSWECPHILRELLAADHLYFDRVSQIVMDRWSRGRVALVGDAAFCVSLMAGQGSALGMTAAYVLAGELASTGGRHEEAFANYERRLRNYIESKRRSAQRFAAAFAPRTSWGLFLRNQVIKSFAIPGLARLALGTDMIDTVKLPTYDWQAPPATAA